MTFVSDDDDVTSVSHIKKKDDIANHTEQRWPPRIRVYYDNGIKLRQQNTVIRTVIAETIQRCEAHMVGVDAFPETARREEFWYNITKQAIKALHSSIGGDSGYQDVYDRARGDKNFVHKIGELVCSVYRL